MRENVRKEFGLDGTRSKSASTSRARYAARTRVSVNKKLLFLLNELQIFDRCGANHQWRGLALFPRDEATRWTEKAALRSKRVHC